MLQLRRLNHMYFFTIEYIKIQLKYVNFKFFCKIYSVQFLPKLLHHFLFFILRTNDFLFEVKIFFV